MCRFASAFSFYIYTYYKNSVRNYSSIQYDLPVRISMEMLKGIFFVFFVKTADFWA